MLNNVKTNGWIENNGTLCLNVNNIPNYVNKIESEVHFKRMYNNDIDEKKCRVWLNVLGFCTQIIKKGSFSDYFETVDKLKRKVNAIYDRLLDSRLGCIDFDSLRKKEKEDERKRMYKKDDDYYYDEDY